MTNQIDYDYVIVGSGFGGSVSAYRLSQKGYKVLVVEKGRRFNPSEFSEGTSKLGSWIWSPKIGLRGIMKMTFLRHVAVMSGVGVGGGSLVYGATLPVPKDDFFTTGSWSSLRDWKADLCEHYQTALKMLGATKNPNLTNADNVLQKLAKSVNKEHTFEPTNVGIFFSEDGKSGSSVPDPYFDGEGPARVGCIQCGDCMTGCRYGAKNSLDKNYLYLAEKLGATVMARAEVTDVIPIGTTDGSLGYSVYANQVGRKKLTLRAKGVIFSGGVMGTIPLLLKLKAKGSLPRLSDMVGRDVRTNNESMTSVVGVGEHPNFSNGVTIGSIFHPDENSHVEPIRLGPKSGLWRFMVVPMATGRNIFVRLKEMLASIIKDPVNTSKAWFARDFGGRSITLLFMQHLDSTVTFKRGMFGQLSSKVEAGQMAPSADIPLSNQLAEKTAEIIDGKAMRLSSEVFLGAPATAHVLGGAVMGANDNTGVIDDHNRVFNYENLYVCDGSAISANPGVNPSLSITALTEHAMSKIPAVKTLDESIVRQQDQKIEAVALAE